ncbi:MAG: phasin family protein [Kangiellaceae bacterium]|nr:phasin family protein [Kangiellaceae bacterium]
MSNLDSIKERVSVAEDFARKIWLAGLGAYGKSYEEVQERVESINVSKVFEDLVSKGEKLEAEAKTKIKENTDFDIKGRVEEVREKLGLNNKSNSEKIDDLSAKIEALAASIEKLSAK